MFHYRLQIASQRVYPYAGWCQRLLAGTARGMCLPICGYPISVLCQYDGSDGFSKSRGLNLGIHMAVKKIGACCLKQCRNPIVLMSNTSQGMYWIYCDFRVSISKVQMSNLEDVDMTRTSWSSRSVAFNKEKYLHEHTTTISKRWSERRSCLKLALLHYIWALYVPWSKHSIWGMVHFISFYILHPIMVVWLKQCHKRTIPQSSAFL